MIYFIKKNAIKLSKVCIASSLVLLMMVSVANADVIASISGNVSGNVSGDVSGDASGNPDVSGDPDEAKQYINLEDCLISGIEDETTFTGEEIMFNGITVEYDGIEFEEDIDYYLEYGNNIDAGEDAYVTIISLDNEDNSVVLQGEITYNFTINKKSIENAEVTLNKCNLTYNGSAIKPTVSKVEVDGIELDSSDYKVDYKNNVYAGKASIVITANNGSNYCDSYTKTFVISKASISYASVSKLSNLTYTGNACTQSIKVTLNNKTLKYGTDYTISYKNNINVGKATVTISGCKNYYGSITRTFTISKANIAKTTVNSLPSLTYTGKKRVQTIIVKYYGKTLKYNKDYYLTYYNNTNIGIATVVITAKSNSNFTGTKKLTFKINPAKIYSLKCSTYTTNSIKLTWNKVSKATSYNVYRYDSKRKKYTYLGKTKSNSYTMNRLPAGSTYNFAVIACTYTNKSTYYGACSNILTVTTKPYKTEISKISSKSRKASITWNKVSSASGYEIYISTSKYGKYTKIADITKNNILSYTRSNLRSYKNYYFKIRSYKNVSKSRVYSDFSSVKIIKVR